MALHISCSSIFMGMGDSFDKVTHEYDPPSFWFRLEASSTGKNHNNCSAEIVSVWNSEGRFVNGVDPIKMFWISEPVSNVRKEELGHYSPTVYTKKPELLGFAHIKLLRKYRNANYEVPENNTPSHKVPEVKLDCSKQENKMAAKKMTLPYGIYFIEVMLMDSEGESISEIFKIWTGPNPKECFIRAAYFYEKWKISWSEMRNGIDLGSGLPPPKKKKKVSKVVSAQKPVSQKNISEKNKADENNEKIGSFCRDTYKSNVLEVLQQK